MEEGDSVTKNSHAEMFILELRKENLLKLF